MRNQTTRSTHKIPVVMAFMATAAILAFTTIMTVSAQSEAPDWKQSPTGLNMTAGDQAGELDISWEPHPQTSKTLQDYRVTWAPDGESFKTPNQTDWFAYPTTNEVTVTGLDAGETYKVRVRARYDDNKKSSWSQVVSGQTGVTPNSPNTAEPPAQVMGVVIAASDGTLSVEWAPVSDATGYKVQWKSGGQRYKPAREASIISSPTPNYAITGLNNGTEYRVRVIATKTGANDGPPSSDRTGTPTSSSPTVTFGPGRFTASENGRTATVTVEISVAVDVTIPLRVQRQNGASSADYSGVPPHLVFKNGNTVRSFTVTAVDDSDNDDDEKIRITFDDLPNGIQTGARSAVNVRLQDNDDGNRAPRFAMDEQILYMVENTPPNQNVGNPITATDGDGDTITYTFGGPDMDRFTFIASTAQIRTKAGQTYDYETHELFVVRVTADDGNGGTATATLVINVVDVDED